MKEKFIYLLSLIFECSLLVVIFLYFDKFLIIPMVLLFILIVFTIISFFIIIFKGKKYIKIENEKLFIIQKNKVMTINKNELKKIVVVFDTFFESIDFIKFQYNDKKYFFEVPNEVNDDLKKYINDLNYKRKKSILLRIIAFILDAFHY